jgi:GNAT superfamily N-acetyltransferase
MHFRTATARDADTVAALHADSWRRHYRGAYSDSFLDGDVLADRRAVWSQRLAANAGTVTLIAEDDAGTAGFVHVVFDEDERWGSLVDNLHVTNDRRRTGIGRALLHRAADAVSARAEHAPMYLWVLQQNTAAQRFYAAMGGKTVEKALVRIPGGDPSRLCGRPGKLRIAWPDAGALAIG